MQSLQMEIMRGMESDWRMRRENEGKECKQKMGES
jgi:hypothetical protein